MRGANRGKTAPKPRISRHFEAWGSCNYRFPRSGEESRPVVYCRPTVPNVIPPDIYVVAPTGQKSRQESAEKRDLYQIFKFGWFLYPPLPRSWPNLAWQSGPIVYHIMPNFTVIGKYCGLYGTLYRRLMVTRWSSHMPNFICRPIGINYSVVIYHKIYWHSYFCERSRLHKLSVNRLVLSDGDCKSWTRDRTE